MTLAELAENAAATHRLSRLVVTDSIAEPVRDRWVALAYRLARKEAPERSAFKPWAEVAMDDPDHPKLVELVSCQFCVGIWAAALVVVLRRHGGPAGNLLCSVMAVAGVQAAWSEWMEKQ